MTKGFTLIEILIVLFIFSVILSFVVINTNFHYKDTMKTEHFAQKLLSTIQLAKQEAVLQHTTLRLTIENDQYGLSKEIRVKPAASLADLNHVYVAKRDPQTIPDESAATSENESGVE